MSLVDYATKRLTTRPTIMDKNVQDMVNKPAHYKIKDGLELIDIRTALAEKIQRENIFIPFADYSDWDRALEYIIRAPFKNGHEDYCKSLYYLTRLTKRCEERGNYVAPNMESDTCQR